MLSHWSRMLVTAALATLITLSTITLSTALHLPSASAAAASPTGPALPAGDTPTVTGTLTDVLAGLLAALLGGQTVDPPPPSAAPAPGPQAGVPLALAPGFEDRVVRLLNQRRSAAGCRRLRANASLQRAARTHSVGMAQFGTMTHDLPGEASLGQRVTFAGYGGWRRLAENIASGFSSPRAVVRAWMRSPGHRSNILDCRLRQTGVGVVVRGSQTWWTQDFGRR